MAMEEDPFSYRLRDLASSITAKDAELAELRSQRAKIMVEARSAGMTFAKIAALLGVTKAYVHQIVTKATKDTSSES